MSEILFIGVCSLIIAVTDLAFSMQRSHDQKMGVRLKPGSYSFLGTIRDTVKQYRITGRKNGKFGKK